LFSFLEPSSSPYQSIPRNGKPNDLPSSNCFSKVFKSIIISEQSGISSDITLPDSVYDAIEYYYLPVFSNSVYANTFLIEAAQDVVDGNSIFNISNTENMAKVLNFYESLLEAIID